MQVCAAYDHTTTNKSIEQGSNCLGLGQHYLATTRAVMINGSQRVLAYLVLYLL